MYLLNIWMVQRGMGIRGILSHTFTILSMSSNLNYFFLQTSKGKKKAIEIWMPPHQYTQSIYISTETSDLEYFFLITDVININHFKLNISSFSLQFPFPLSTDMHKLRHLSLWVIIHSNLFASAFYCLDVMKNETVIIVIPIKWFFFSLSLPDDFQATSLASSLILGHYSISLHAYTKH